MTREDVVVPMAENAEAEVGMIGNINATIKHKKALGEGPTGGSIGNGSRRSRGIGVEVIRSGNRRNNGIGVGVRKVRRVRGEFRKV